MSSLDMANQRNGNAASIFVIKACRAVKPTTLTRCLGSLYALIIHA